MRRATILAGALCAGAAAGGGPGAAPAAEPPRPLLVSVDDLPVAGAHPAPGERKAITEGLLGALARHRVPAVGLVTWQNAQEEGDPALLEAWLAAGHELGNHSWKHLSYTATDSETYVADVERARVRLAALLAPRAQTPRFFRFPFLREGDTEAKLDAMRAYLKDSGQRELTVTIDTQDWSFDKPWTEAARAGDTKRQEQVAADYLAALRISVRHHEATGDALFGRPLPQVLLLHANAVGAAHWDRLFTWLEETGHRFATADEVLADPAFREPHRYVGPYGFSLWDRLGDARRQREAKEQVAALLAKQSEDWNRADLEGFCSVYAEDAAYLGARGLVRGRQAILDQYRQRYGGDTAGMGALTLEVIEARTASGTEVSLLGDAVPGDVWGVSVVARWRLRYPDKPEKSGLTLVVFRRKQGGWELVQDASL